MDNDSNMASASGTGLPMNEADKSFSPAVGIPDAETLGKACADALNPKDFEPFLRKVTEDIYERLLFTVEDYLKENTHWNIAERVKCAEETARSRWVDLRDIEDALGCYSGDRLDRVKSLVERSRLYDELIYQVGMKHDGETRHETALRYMRNAEKPRDSDASLAQNAKRSSGEAVAARAEGIAQGDTP